MISILDGYDPMTFSPEDFYPPHQTISLADTTLSACTPAPSSVCDMREDGGDEKRPVKKRKSWGQELPVPKTNLPPRKRAKTEDEKEQRRIERVLRNRQAAQSSRERKRQEVEKLEGEKSAIETMNDKLKELLMAAEHDKYVLEQKNRRLTDELAALKGGPSNRSSLAPSPSFSADGFKNQQAIKQENEDSHCHPRTPISLLDVVRPAVSIRGGGVGSIDSTYDSRQNSLNSVTLLQQQPTSTKPHYAHQQPLILSDAYLNGLFATPATPPADISFFEDGFTTTEQCDDPSNVFTFDSMVDLDANGAYDIKLDSHTLLQDDDITQLQADLSHPTAPASPALQPCLGAPSSGRDGSGNAS
ncbi:MAG: hypothetical protein Q9202_003884 [Teloschistes flavicans]